jgi:serine/threonine protein kinase
MTTGKEVNFPLADNNFSCVSVSHSIVERLVSRGARELVQAMLEADPKKRISAKDALQHPWVRIHTEPAILASNSAKKFVDGAACTIS